VSGGVFDVARTDEIIVPIDAGVKVFEPTLFAVTTEPPGGVVQHDPDLDREKYRIILTAPVDAP
jgi:anti-sigma-K factor RskA